jgi:hypothetical protein
MTKIWNNMNVMIFTNVMFVPHSFASFLSSKLDHTELNMINRERHEAREIIRFL